MVFNNGIFYTCFLIFSIVTSVLFYYYSQQIAEIDDVVAQIAFDIDQNEYDETFDSIITPEQWESLSLSDIDEILIANDLEPIGDSQDPFYELTPQEIDEYIKDDAIFIGEQMEDSGAFEDGLGLDPIDLSYISLEQIQKIQEDISTSAIKFIILILFCITFIFAFVSYYFASRSLKPLEEAIEKQNRFVSDSSHELRTPLALIKAEAEVLLRNTDSTMEEYKEFAQNTVKDVNRLSLLTDNLLSLARLDQGKQVVHLADIHIKEQVKDVLKSFSTSIKSKNIKIENKVGDDIYIKSDKNILTHILTIVIDNAIKYSHDSGVLAFDVKKERNGFSLSIKDQGPGISAQDLKHIFDRFYRVSQDRHEAGYGLGLAIAKDLVELQGGTILIESTQGKGTCVKLFFKA